MAARPLRGAGPPTRDDPHPLCWARPTISRWAASGHRSLRETTRDDVLASLAPSGNERATTAIALRSIFQTLKARKVIFTNPTINLNPGAPASREPLPVNVGRLWAVLTAPDPVRAALGVLVVFHASSNRS